METRSITVSLSHGLEMGLFGLDLSLVLSVEDDTISIL